MAVRSRTMPRTDPIIVATPSRRRGADGTARAASVPGRSAADRSAQAGRAEVAHGEPQRVGGVGRSWWPRQVQQPRDHAPAPAACRRAVAGDGELHLVRAVLDHRHARAPRDRERQPAGLPDGHGGPRVDLEQHPLDGERARAELGDERRRARAGGRRAARATRPGLGADHAEGRRDQGCRLPRRTTAP